MSYPRTCRNGHVIAGPEDEHLGEHRQCRECRHESQRNAMHRYRRDNWMRNEESRMRENKTKRTRQIAESRAARGTDPVS
jgi:hypothetical protein